MSSLNIGQDWSIVTDAANNRLLVEYEPNGNRYALGEDGTLKPLDGGLDTDILNGADLANSASGEVPKSDGSGNLTMGPVQTEANVPDDVFIKKVDTGLAASHTVSFANDYDFIFCRMKSLTQGSTFQPIGMRFNGVSGSSYQYTTADGVESGSQTEVYLSEPGTLTSGQFLVRKDEDYAAFDGPFGRGGDDRTTVTARSTDGASWPIDSLEFLGVDGGNISVTAKFYGWNY